MNLTLEIERHEQQLAQDKARAWRELVISTTDHTPEIGDVVAELNRLGRSAKELESACDRLRERRRLADVVATGEKSTAELTEVEGRLAKVEAAFQKERLKFDNLAEPLRADIAKHREAMQQADEARRSLRLTASEELLEQMETDLRRGMALDAEMNRLAQAIESTETSMATWRASNSSRKDQEIANLEAKISTLRDQLKAVEADKAAAESDRSNASLRTLDPMSF